MIIVQLRDTVCQRAVDVNSIPRNSRWIGKA